MRRYPRSREVSFPNEVGHGHLMEHGCGNRVDRAPDVEKASNQVLRNDGRTHRGSLSATRRILYRRYIFLHIGAIFAAWRHAISCLLQR